MLIPFLALVFGHVAGAITLGPLMVSASIGIFAAIDFAIFRIGVKLVKREEILSKLA